MDDYCKHEPRHLIEIYFTDFKEIISIKLINHSILVPHFLYDETSSNPDQQQNGPQTIL